MNRGWIHVHIGQGGVQIGEKFWELYCRNAGITEEGERVMKTDGENVQMSEEQLNSFFQEKPNKCLKPRAIFVDIDDIVTSRVKKGPFGRMLSPEQFASYKDVPKKHYGMPSGSSLFAIGYYTEGKDLLEKRMKGIFRKEVECCSGLEGLVVTNAISGGTGSGLGSRFLRHVSDEYKGINIINHMICPSPNLSNIVVEPYNSVLYLGKQLLEQKSSGLGANICYDNETMYNMLNIGRAKYTNINRLVAQISSSVFSNLVFNDEGDHVDIRNVFPKLSPIPKYDYLVPSISPILKPDDDDDNLEEEEEGRTDLEVSDLMKKLFSRESRMYNIDPYTPRKWRKKNKKKKIQPGRKTKKDVLTYQSNAMMFHGKEIRTREIFNAIHQVKEYEGEEKLDEAYNAVQFANPAGFTYQTSQKRKEFIFGGSERENKIPLRFGTVEKLGCMLSNCDGFRHSLKRMLDNFRLIWMKRAFVHHFVGFGMEEGEFVECRNAVRSLVDSYESKYPMMEEEDEEE